MQSKRCIHNQTNMNFREHGTAQSRTPHLYTRLKDTGFPLDNPECIPYPKGWYNQNLTEMFHGVMPVQGGAHRPRLEEWRPFSAQVANDETSIRTNRRLIEKPDLHHSFTSMCHNHRSGPLTSAQTFVFPEGVHLLHQAYTRRLDVHTSRSPRASLEFDQTLTAMRHTPCGRQAVASLNRARWGDNVYTPVHKGWLVPVATTGAPSPTTGLNQTPTAMHPSPIVPTIQPTEFCGSL